MTISWYITYKKLRYKLRMARLDRDDRITVIAEDDEVTTGPGWGTAPAELATNNIPNAYQHTIIETLGQVSQSSSTIDSPVVQSLSLLPLLQNDVIIAFRGATSNTQRNLVVATSGYTKLDSMFSNGTQDPNGCLGYKVMG